METKETLKTYIKNCWRWILVGVLLGANFFVWYIASENDRHAILTVSVLDVGQGDAIFIEAPSGNQMLIDGGPPGKIMSELSRVMPFYDRTIDLLALSHPHLDHFAGLIDVLGRYEVGGIVTSGTKNSTSEYESFVQAEKNAGLDEIVLRHGSRIDMGDGVFLDVLLPEGDASDASPHSGMLVMRLSYGSTSVMLTGDMEANLEAYLVKRDDVGLKSDVLKAGHHGSKTSTSEVFLKLVNPEAVIISSGKDNKFGHPNKETLDVLERFHVKTYRTDERGTVTLTSDGNEISFYSLSSK